VAAARAQLFFAPIAPRGSNYESMPGMPRPFGKWFGRFPESNFLEWHKHFRQVGEQVSQGEAPTLLRAAPRRAAPGRATPLRLGLADVHGGQYGGLVRKRVMGRNIVVVTDLELIREICRDKEHFRNRAPTGIGQIIPLGLLGPS
jgi:hypothetical protein